MDISKTIHHNTDMKDEQGLIKIAENTIGSINDFCKNFINHGQVIFTFRIQDGKTVYQEVDFKRSMKVKDAKLVY